MGLEVRSRAGNAVLGILGVVYLCAAVALLAYDLVQTWGAAGLIDRAVQAALIVSALAGIFFIVTARRNLELRLRSGGDAPLHREGAVSAPESRRDGCWR